MLLRVLGSLEVAGSDGPVALGAAKPRALLAALAINRGSICTADALIDALWGDTPPASAAKLLQVYVSQLRRVLPPGIRIVTGTAGYRLELDASEVDAVRFERQLDEGRAASARRTRTALERYQQGRSPGRLVRRTELLSLASLGRCTGSASC